jgi:outer membrane protein assembly factor BamB
MIMYFIFAFFALAILTFTATAHANGPYITRDVIGDGGVTVYKPDKCYNGYTLFCRNRGDHFYLIDMEGNVAHTWKPVSSIHFAELLPNGNLLYSTADRADTEENQGVHELDWDSNEVWWYKCHVDHDHTRLDNGNSMMLCREEVNRPEIYDQGPIFSPFYIEVTPQKEIAWEWHGYEHIEELKELVGIEFPRHEKDWAHDNTLDVLPQTRLGKEDARFKAGNVMFSYRNIDTIGIIDKETKKIVWAWGPGVLDRQHMPTMLPDGHILIFDNGTHRKYSRILEIDPRTGETLWNYTADPPESFFSSAVSGQERLPNGNTLICSGGQGRIFEVTMEGEIVWEYVNPYHGEGGRGNGLYRHSGRYTTEFIEQLLK